MSNKGLPIVLLFVFVVGFCLFSYGLLLVVGSTSNTGQAGWLGYGLGFLALGGAIAGWAAYGMYKRNQNPPNSQDPSQPMPMDIPGDVKISNMKCNSCGGAINSNDIKLQNNVPTVICPWCGATYQVSEEPKW